MSELFLAFLVLLSESGTHECDRIRFAASAIASEAASQPFEAQVNVARAVRDHAPCGNTNYLSGYALAMRTTDRNNHHWRAYFAPYSFTKERQDQWLLASAIAYTEQPRVPVRHFDRADGGAWWWHSPKACPNRAWVVGDLQFCN